MPKPAPLDPAEQHILEHATRFQVVTPWLGLGERHVRICYFFDFEAACDYARWLENMIPALRHRVLVYALEHDHPEAPAPSQQWRSAMIPKEYWI